MTETLTLDSEIGEYETWSSEMSAEVRKAGKVIKKFRGETAWSDAERFAWDLYAKDLREKF